MDFKDEGGGGEAEARERAQDHHCPRRNLQPLERGHLQSSTWRALQPRHWLQVQREKELEARELHAELRLLQVARQPQPARPREACEAPSQPVWGEAEVSLLEGDDKSDIVYAGELLQHEGMGREEEEEAAGESGAEQRQPNLGSDQRRWGAHPRQVEGVQAYSKHHEGINERAPVATRRDLLL